MPPIAARCGHDKDLKHITAILNLNWYLDESEFNADETKSTYEGTDQEAHNGPQPNGCQNQACDGGSWRDFLTALSALNRGPRHCTQRNNSGVPQNLKTGPRGGERRVETSSRS